MACAAPAWSYHGCTLKGLSVKFCCQRAASRRGDRAVLVSLVDHLKSQVDRGSTSCVGPYHSALAELERRDTEAAQGLKVRARIHCRRTERPPPPTFFAWLRDRRRSPGLQLSGTRMAPSFPTQMTSCGSCLRFTRTFLQQKTPTKMRGPPCSQTSSRGCPRRRLACAKVSLLWRSAIVPLRAWLGVKPRA